MGQHGPWVGLAGLDLAGLALPVLALAALVRLAWLGLAWLWLVWFKLLVLAWRNGGFWRKTFKGWPLEAGL